jgi:putative ABC transport system ATP-binding protein
MDKFQKNIDFDSDRPILTMSNVCKSYMLGSNELKVLQAIEISIKKGEFVAIMGPSGSGKSTLLNLIGCLDKPTGGTYILGDQNVATLDDNHLSTIRGAYIGFVFQSFNLIQQLNVLENIEGPMYYQGASETISRQRAKELAMMVGLGERTNHKPNELSGGQQQRVAIARSLVNDPLIILADEPTGNLDSTSGADILKILLDLHNQGKTLIVITHDEKIAAYAQRIIKLFDGRILKETYN